MNTDLSKYNNSWFDPGRKSSIRFFWYAINVIFFQNKLNIFSTLKIVLLKFFGAKIGVGVIVKPSVNVKYPWNLKIGDYSWIGEKAWLDSLAPIVIGSNVCISQGVYFCTGNHDWSDPAFGLIVKPIIIEDGAWVGARVTVLPGVTIASHSIVTAGSVISKNTEPYMVYTGNPAVKIKERNIK